MKKCHKCYALYGNSDCICPPKLPSPAQMAEQQLATLTQERDALKRIIDDTLREVPVGNVNAHIPENLPMDMEYYVQETVKQDFEIERLEKERDALKSQWAIMARACGNWREWPEGTVSESAPDYTHSGWQAAARAILERDALVKELETLRSSHAN